MKADDPGWGCIYPGCGVHPAKGGGPVFRISPKGKGETFVGACGPHLAKATKSYKARHK